MKSPDKAPVIMLSAGEASGDQHAASLYLELKKLMPEVKAIGMGGAAMREAGVDIRYDSTSIAVIGTVEVIKHLLVPKLQLGNAFFEAPASRETSKQELARQGELSPLYTNRCGSSGTPKGFKPLAGG